LGFRHPEGPPICCAGITQRFGEDIFERLEREGQVQIVWPNRNNPDVEGKFTWMLTKQVRALDPA